MIVNAKVDNPAIRSLQSIMAESAEIRQWLLGQIGAKMDSDLVARATQTFGITRQAVARHLRKLMNEQIIVAQGHTKARRYKLALVRSYSQVYSLGSDFQEDVVWSQDLRPLLTALPENILAICEYGVTEMLNNAKDHSAAQQVAVSLELTVAELNLTVSDGGVGIFRKIKDACGLEDERHAILELVKGRLTTDPEHHTGEGIFFTSRVFDQFLILSGSLSLVHNREGADWLIDDAKPIAGTYVVLRIQPTSTHTVQEVFNRYATVQDDYAFRQTHLHVALAQTDGASLISRSQAKRIMARCDRFREVVLDFRGVDSIGPAFADEIFRVWRRAHLQVTLTPIRMNDVVERMVRRALAAENPDTPSAPSEG